MLVELAAANAAFAVIKEAVANAGDLMAAGQKVFEYFDAKAAIQRKANAGGNKSDMEEFMALEQLKKQEEQLKQMMIYQGRPGLWYDWLKFQAQAARNREAAKRAAELKRLKFRERLSNIFWWSVLVVTLIGWIVGGVWFYLLIKER